jgi:hypothetical protein
MKVAPTNRLCIFEHDNRVRARRQHPAGVDQSRLTRPEVKIRFRAHLNFSDHF